MDNKKNEELQSRREFFKSAAKAALPVIGAVVLSHVPLNVDAAPTGCDYYCSGGCSAHCQNSCVNYCSTGCYGTCQGNCKGHCQNSCRNGSWNTSY